MAQNHPSFVKKRTMSVTANIYKKANNNKTRNSDLNSNSPNRPTRNLKLRGINTVNIVDKNSISKMKIEEDGNVG